MTKREAKKVAHAVVAGLIRRYELEDDGTAFRPLGAEDRERIDDAITELFVHHEARGLFEVPGGGQL